jgi:hypothetical protein
MATVPFPRFVWTRPGARALAPWVLLLWLTVSIGASLFACCDLGAESGASAAAGHHHDDGTATGGDPCPTLSDLAFGEPVPIATNSHLPDQFAWPLAGHANSLAARSPDSSRTVSAGPPPPSLAVYRATARLRI